MVRPGFWLLLVAISLAVRVLYTTVAVGWSTSPQAEAEGASDGVWYDAVARNVALGNGYSVVAGQPTAVKPPGYPLFVAGVYWVFGTDGYAAVRVVQVILASLVPLLAYRVGVEVFGETAARTGGLLAAVDPALTYLAPAFLSETLYIFLVSLALWWLARLRRRFSRGLVLMAGLLLGLATLTRANLVLLLPMLPLWAVLAFGRSRRRWVGVLLLAVVSLVVGSWTVRNYIALHSFVALSTHGGSAFWGGNNPYAEGDWVEESRTLRLASPPSDIGEVEWDRAAYRLGVAWITDHPVDFTLLVAKKLVRFFDFDPHSARPGVASLYRLIGFFPYGLLFPVMVIGIVGETRNRKAWLLYFVVLAAVLNALVFYGDPRMRSPIQPYLYLFASTVLGRVATHRALLQPLKRIVAGPYRHRAM